MDWLLLILISVGTSAISNLLQRVLMREKKSDNVAYGLAFQLTCAALIGIFAAWNGFVLPPLRELPLNFFLLTVLYASGTLFLFKALQTTEASEVTILFSSRALWTITLALLFLGESFDIKKAIGTLFILAAIFFVTQRTKSFSFNKGSVYALIAAFCYGVAFINDAYILRRAEALSYTATAFLLPGLAIIIFKPRVLNEMKRFLDPSLLLKMLLLGVFYSTSAVTYFLAYQGGGGASQLAPILQSTVVITVLLAAIFLNERSNLSKKLFSALMVSMGVLLIR